MPLGLMIGLFIVGFTAIIGGKAANSYEEEEIFSAIGVILLIGSLGMFIFRMFLWIFKSSIIKKEEE